MVVAPTADLVVLDPVVTFNRQTHNYAHLVFDTLYGLDTSWQVQPQMVEGHEVDDDGLTSLLRLRDGLLFHGPRWGGAPISCWASCAISLMPSTPRPSSTRDILPTAGAPF